MALPPLTNAKDFFLYIADRPAGLRPFNTFSTLF